MKWWRRKSREAQTQPAEPSLLEEAEQKLADIHRRAERVAPALHSRKQRNHWGETVSAIARREAT